MLLHGSRGVKESVCFSCLYQVRKDRAIVATHIRVIDLISEVLNPKTLAKT
ncbi:MAG: hypothetical protein NW220_22570 [Leptolyngbyaceae cyanobacterium bins.349]|nr:hypothetical protein [Leptolyngbyaceae cyanobacterium bins.349]